MVRVKQESDLGMIALSALLHKGFCGPNYDLSDIEVDVEKTGRSFAIGFYDMNMSVGEQDRFYRELNEHYQGAKR